MSNRFIDIIQSPTVTDPSRALLLHLDRLKRDSQKAFSPYETKQIREDVRDLMAALKEVGDQVLIERAWVLMRKVDRKHALNVKEWQKQGLIQRRGNAKTQAGLPEPMTFFSHNADRSLCFMMANVEEHEFLEIIGQVLKEGNFSDGYLYNRFKPLTDEEKQLVATIERRFDEGAKRKEVIDELELTRSQCDRLFPFVPLEKRKAARDRLVRKHPKKQSVHSMNIALQAIKQMEEGLDLFDLIDVDKFTPANRRTVVTKLRGVVRDIRNLIGEETD